MRPTFGKFATPVLGVDKEAGETYKVIELVAQHLPDLVYLARNLSAVGTDYFDTIYYRLGKDEQTLVPGLTVANQGGESHISANNGLTFNAPAYTFTGNAPVSLPAPQFLSLGGILLMDAVEEHVGPFGDTRWLKANQNYLQIMTDPVTHADLVVEAPEDGKVHLRAGSDRFHPTLVLEADYVNVAGRFTINGQDPFDNTVLTGNPTAPTPVAGSSDNQLATTEFVAAAMTSANVFAPSDAIPKVNGNAGAGISPLGARADHVHPIDSSRASVASLNAATARITNLENDFVNNVQSAGDVRYLRSGQQLLDVIKHGSNLFSISIDDGDTATSLKMHNTAGAAVGSLKLLNDVAIGTANIVQGTSTFIGHMVKPNDTKTAWVYTEAGKGAAVHMSDGVIRLQTAVSTGNAAGAASDIENLATFQRGYTSIGPNNAETGMNSAWNWVRYGAASRSYSIDSPYHAFGLVANGHHDGTVWKSDNAGYVGIAEVSDSNGFRVMTAKATLPNQLALMSTQFTVSDKSVSIGMNVPYDSGQTTSLRLNYNSGLFPREDNQGFCVGQNVAFQGVSGGWKTVGTGNGTVVQLDNDGVTSFWRQVGNVSAGNVNATAQLVGTIGYRGMSVGDQVPYSISDKPSFRLNYNTGLFNWDASGCALGQNVALSGTTGTYSWKTVGAGDGGLFTFGNNGDFNIYTAAGNVSTGGVTVPLARTVLISNRDVQFSCNQFHVAQQATRDAGWGGGWDTYGFRRESEGQYVGTLALSLGVRLSQTCSVGFNTSSAAAIWMMYSEANGNNLRFVAKTGDKGANCTIEAAAFAQNSDERLKKDLTPITGALDFLKGARTVTGRWKTGVDTGLHNFFIAQDWVGHEGALYMSSPDLEGNQYLQMAYSETIPVVAAAVKELAEENDALKSEVAELKELVKQLLAKVQ